MGALTFFSSCSISQCECLLVIYNFPLIRPPSCLSINIFLQEPARLDRRGWQKSGQTAKIGSILYSNPLLSSQQFYRQLAVSLFGNTQVGKMRNTCEHQRVSIRQQDPNKYSDTETRALSRTPILQRNVDEKGGKYTEAKPRCTCLPPSQHCSVHLPPL